MVQQYVCTEELLNEIFTPKNVGFINMSVIDKQVSFSRDMTFAIITVVNCLEMSERTLCSFLYATVLMSLFLFT